MADFTRYSDPSPEWIEFEKTWSPAVPDSSLSIKEAQEKANAGTAKLLATVLGLPEGLDISDHTIPTSDGAKISVRLYKPRDTASKLPLYVNFQGGGYYLGNLETDAPGCMRIALNTGNAVLSVNYRRTPEWTFPTPVGDATDAFNWVYTSADQLGIDRERIIVGGVSAGATLAITVALRDLQNKVRRVKGVVLSTPATVHPEHFPRNLVKDGYSSLEQNADAPFINIKRLKFFNALYKPDPTHPEFSPLLLSQEALHGFPPTSFHIAGRDPLRDEGLLFHEKLNRAGVDTKLTVYRGLPHAFMSLPGLVTKTPWSENMQSDIRRQEEQWRDVAEAISPVILDKDTFNATRVSSEYYRELIAKATGDIGI